MQVGGGGGIGKVKRNPNALATNAREGVSGGRGLTADQVRDVTELRRELDEESPLDIAKQIYNFPGRVYDDADQMVRGLIDLGGRVGSNTLNNQAPLEGIEADPIIEQTIHNWTHPVEYANEHPFQFMLDVGGAAAGGSAALRAGASRVGAPSVGALLREETGAIGELGRRFEAGDVGHVEPLRGQMDLGIAQGSAGSNPELYLSRYDDGFSGIAVGKVDPTSSRAMVNQGLGEALSSQLNAGTGGRLRMPGAARADLPTEAGLMRGGLIEYVDDVSRIDDRAQLDYGNPEVLQQRRNMDIFDRIIGNDDRAFGANMHVTGPPDNYMPIAIDNGGGWRRGMDFETLKDPSAWNTGRKQLSPEEFDWVSQMRDYIQNNPGGAFSELDPSNVRGVMNRIRQLLEERELPSPYSGRTSW